MKAGRPSKDKKDSLELSDVTNKSKNLTRVNFNIDEEIYLDFKKYALDNRTNVTKLLIEMIETRLNER